MRPLLVASLLLLAACDGATLPPDDPPTPFPSGCDVDYPSLTETPYVLPFPVGRTFETGLTNCTASFHRAGQPDELAFDFAMPVGEPFVAARAGTAYVVEEGQPSEGSTVGSGNPVLSYAGNYVVIEHDDGTFGAYLHAPRDGIDVEQGQRVQQGQRLGVAGRSGLAGYSHLHFIVLTGNPAWPYTGVPVSFANAEPSDLILKRNARYSAAPY